MPQKRNKTRNTLKKKERLYLRNRVQSLFSYGKSFRSYPFRIVYLLESTSKDLSKDNSPLFIEEETGFLFSNRPFIPNGVEILISVSKHRFRRAVDRNRIKRLLRETYRQHPLKRYLDELSVSKHFHLSISFIVLTDILLSYDEMAYAVHKSLVKLVNEIDKALNKEISIKRD